MKKISKLVLVVLACVVLFGCAHPISMNPNLANVQAKNITPIDRQVGFYISDANKAIEVTTAGGGGDKVRYFPYRDIEAGFYKALGEVFRGVSKVKEPTMTDDMRKSGISLLIVPEISTTSSSPSPFTWPPTLFTLTLSSTVIDVAGRVLRKVTVVGEGKAEFDEFKGNHSLSAVRASNEALSKLIVALEQAPELKVGVVNGGPANGSPLPSVARSSPTMEVSGVARADLRGQWSGKYTCGAYAGKGQVNRPEGFVDRVSMAVTESGLTMLRKGPSFSEAISGPLTDELTASLQGQGAFTSAPDKPWLTKFAGRFSVVNGLVKFNANGQLTTVLGAVSRECVTEMVKSGV